MSIKANESSVHTAPRHPSLRPTATCSLPCACRLAALITAGGEAISMQRLSAVLYACLTNSRIHSPPSSTCTHRSSSRPYQCSSRFRGPDLRSCDPSWPSRHSAHRTTPLRPSVCCPYATGAEAPTRNRFPRPRPAAPAHRTAHRLMEIPSRWRAGIRSSRHSVG